MHVCTYPHEGGTEGARILSRLCAEHGTPHRARSHHPEIMIGAKTKTWRLNRLHHPGTPLPVFLLSLNMDYSHLYS